MKRDPVPMQQKAEPVEGIRGRLAETIAARYLIEHGAVIIDRNVSVGRGELDIITREGDDLVCVEVRSRTLARGVDVFSAVPEAKLEQVRRLCQLLNPRPTRIDLVLVGYGHMLEIRWLKGVA